MNKATALVLALAVVAAGWAPAGEWTMRKEAQMIVPASAGGGADIAGRVIADIVMKNKLASRNFVVVNKPGGAAAVGYNYMESKKGDPYTLLSLHSGALVTSYVGGWKKGFDELIEIIAIMAWDDVTLCVRSDSQWPDIQSLLAYAKENPGVVRFGSDQRLNSSQLAFELIKIHTGADMNYVQYDSSGDVAGALLGGHVDVGILNPGECLGQVLAEQFVPIVTFAPERIKGKYFEDAPTFVEIGYPEFTYREFRGLAGTKDMPMEAIR
ncbi:MAG: tripartite tricarboxylate transporter substrate binding protein, partial [Planctomycetes bacterium]|nr:tripartite tricarboxylate transporter substrate binding protein [Planctomycetota bacterium]